MNLKFSKNNRLIAYNNIGLVDSIQFSTRANVAYTYAMNGEKLKVVHRAASRSMASAEILAAGDFPIVPMPIVNTSVREYILGNIEKDYEETVIGNTYRYYFGNGYVKFSDGFAALNPQYFFYTKDHLGNIRSVATKTNGVVEEVQHTAYYPFGGIISDLSTGRDVQNRLYNGKELDTSNNLWWYDYGARQYDPTAPRFTTPDPLAEKYFSNNYFTYCMNNPVKFVDPDGRKIEFAAGTSDEFKSMFQQAVNYLIENGCGKQYETLQNSKLTFTIKEGESNSYKNQTITWAPMNGLMTNELNFLSPTTLLNHEMGHGEDFLNDIDGYAQKTQTDPNSLYHTQTDEFVITNIETPTAQALGEVAPNEPSRTDHGGTSYQTISPITNEPIEGEFKNTWWSN